MKHLKSYKIFESHISDDVFNVINNIMFTISEEYGFEAYEVEDDSGLIYDVYNGDILMITFTEDLYKQIRVAYRKLTEDLPEYEMYVLITEKYWPHLRVSTKYSDINFEAFLNKKVLLRIRIDEK